MEMKLIFMTGEFNPPEEHSIARREPFVDMQ
jgi:hypothetical protein